GHLFLDRARPGAGVLIGQKRHRRGLAGPVAFHAAVVEDRRDVASERHLGRRGCCTGNGGRDDSPDCKRKAHDSLGPPPLTALYKKRTPLTLLDLGARQPYPDLAVRG